MPYPEAFTPPPNTRREERRSPSKLILRSKVPSFKVPSALPFILSPESFSLSMAFPSNFPLTSPPT